LLQNISKEYMYVGLKYVSLMSCITFTQALNLSFVQVGPPPPDTNK